MYGVAGVHGDGQSGDRDVRARCRRESQNGREEYMLGYRVHALAASCERVEEPRKAVRVAIDPGHQRGAGRRFPHAADRGER